MAFLYAQCVRGIGIDLVIDHTGLEKAIIHADYVLTGEGIDAQTLYGKTPCDLDIAIKTRLINVERTSENISRLIGLNNK